MPPWRNGGFPFEWRLAEMECLPLHLLTPMAPSGAGTNRPTSTAAFVAGVYFAFGALWILLSDLAMVWAGLIDGAGVWVQSSKGATFVLVSSGLLYWLVQRQIWAIHKTGVLFRHAEHALRVETDRLTQLAAAVPGVLYSFMLRPDGTSCVTYSSPTGEEIYGLRFEDLGDDAAPLFALTHPDDLDQLMSSIAQSARTLSPWHAEFRVRHPRKGEIWIEGNSLPRQEPDGSIVWHGIATDVTERHRRTAQLLQLSCAVEQSPATVVITDATGNITYVNPKFTQLTGYTAKEALGQNPHILKSGKMPASVYEELWTALEQGRDWRGELLNRKKNGELYWEAASISPVRDAAGQVTHYVAVKEDITARKLAEYALRESEERFRQLAENIRAVLWMIDPVDNSLLYISPAYESIWGRSCESAFATPDSWLDALHPEDRQRLAQLFGTKDVADSYDEDYRIIRPDGSVRWIHDKAFPIRDASGHCCRIAGIAEDITEQVHAEETRRQLEAQLRQSQKTEAIGQLAGGIAHDFNNLLGIIIGYGQMLHDGMVKPGEEKSSLRQITQAGERAATLTRQLLAFSRQAVLEPRIVDLNAAIGETLKMLRRLIGEDVQLTTILDPAVPPIRVDPGQLDQILMNLAVNARDAMPQGGKLTIETRHVESDGLRTQTQIDLPPGRYVLLTVGDTGLGMSASVKARIFEPFFTTKAVGQGTGLGLAVVHGIVKQSGGHIDVESEPGQGAVFRIFLPAAEETTSARLEVDSNEEPRGDETILLVEDEDGIRELLAEMLRSHGYTVRAARDGNDALSVAAEEGDRIDLLLTDVVMPNLGGRELANAMCQRFPRMKVLYISGHTDDAVLRHGIAEESVAFLRKPVTSLALTTKVRKVLDSGQEGGLVSTTSISKGA